MPKEKTSFQGARYEQRAKRRKINRILNTLIGFVFALILFFGWQLIFSNNKEQETANKLVDENKKEKMIEKEEIESKENVNVESSENEKNNDDNKELEETSGEATVIEGDPNSNIIQEIVNPSWQPIGTTQSEPHVTTFDKNSVDWKEMIDAISYATRLSPEEMIVWFIGNNGPNKAVATISTKDKMHHYKVYIEWVEQQGWKPTKVQQLRNRE
ncbi:YrrS family protein [Bacillus alveayuensis]|jgi:cytoskeletal protein RodZ|uniref:YrrS family protein n=1 Tax=Aeribacillus alveayuensis TaxID=279215 RepID=UPI0005D10660|nr:YrrS family protein [Bacillus alveayuensis]